MLLTQTALTEFTIPIALKSILWIFIKKNKYLSWNIMDALLTTKDI